MSSAGCIACRIHRSARVTAYPAGKTDGLRELRAGKKGSGYAFQSTIRVVATALDAATHEIVSWEVEGEARKMITRAAGTRRGRSPDSERVADKQQARDVLRQLGYDVDEGEWDARSAERVISALEEAIKPRPKVRKPA
jgi:hypothetical protein